MKFYDLVVIGATFAGIGAASANAGRTIILESRQQIGYEFINSYKYGTEWSKTPETELGLKFKDDLCNRGVLSADGFVHMPALAPIICDYVNKHKLDLLLMTDIINIENTEDLYYITIHNVSGFEVIKAAKVLDTRFNNVKITNKYINAMLTNYENDEVLSNLTYACVEKGLFGEYVLKYEIDIEDNWIIAREKLHRFWNNRPGNLNKWVISSVADCFEIKSDIIKGITNDKVSYICSAAFNNAIQAFEAGVLFW